MYVPRGTRGADLACTISPSRIELRLKKPVDGFGDSEGWLLKGDMPETCRPDESMWMGEFFFWGAFLLFRFSTRAQTWSSN